MQGTVKWYHRRKGYGFIVGEDGNDIFVHHSGIVMDGFKVLPENGKVTYDVEKGEKGPVAVNVKLVEG